MGLFKIITQQDVESLGWIPVEQSKLEDQLEIPKVFYKLTTPKGKYSLRVSEHIGHIMIVSNLDIHWNMTLFDGFVENKQEFEKLMKQTRII